MRAPQRREFGHGLAFVGRVDGEAFDRRARSLVHGELIGPSIDAANHRAIVLRRSRALVAIRSPEYARRLIKSFGLKEG